MKFDVAGPFTLTRYGSKRIITQQTLTDLRPVLEEWETGLASACGCYVFAKRTGGGIMPWYVGQSCKQSLLQESLNPTNREKYRSVMDEWKVGTPVMFYLPLRTPNGSFRKTYQGNSSIASLNFLEKWLIAESINKNPHLLNNKETKFLRNLHVVGLFNAKPGEATNSSTLLKQTLKA